MSFIGNHVNNKRPSPIGNMNENDQNQQSRHSLIGKPVRSVQYSTANNSPILSPVKVVLRVRPFLSEEQDDISYIQLNMDDQVIITNPRNASESINYKFDRCHGDESSQSAIFDNDIKPLLPDLFKGINVTVFAYGNTGAGKTFTMEGERYNPGIIPRSIGYLFDHLARFSQNTFLLISYLEIYNEKVYDLLSGSDHDLAIREDQNRNILIPFLQQIKVHNISEFDKIWNSGRKNRSTAATKLNAHSSRSHSILLVQVDPFMAASNTIPAKLHLIDLAGSEDNRKTDNAGMRLTESGNINKSLFVLGKVVDALHQNSSRIPYRDSKLTRLLQDSLGGRARSVIIANISPCKDHYLETYHTLNFARKSKQIVNKSNQVAIKYKSNPSPPPKQESTLVKKMLQEENSTSNPFTDNNLERKIEALVRSRLKEAVENGGLFSPMKKCQDRFSFGKNMLDRLAILEKKIESTTQLQNLESTVCSVTKNLIQGMRESTLSPFIRPSKDKRGKRKRLQVLEENETCDEKTTNPIIQHPRLREMIENDLLYVFNFGTEKQIKSLAGIGARRCQKLIDERQTSGPFERMNQVQMRCGWTKGVLCSVIQGNLAKKLCDGDKEYLVVSSSCI